MPLGANIDAATYSYVDSYLLGTSNTVGSTHGDGYITTGTRLGKQLVQFKMFFYCAPTCPAGSHPQDAIMVTKCVTIRDFASEDSSEPPQKWVNCFNVTSPMRQALCNPSDWESADTSHVLLHIDVPNQQPYHLPMLITPTLCVYLITFDLRYQKESLARIHSVMKNVYTLSTFATAGGGMEYPPVVLLVGTHADKVKAEDRGCFMQELNRRLEKMPYNRVVKRCGDEPFWAVDGGNLCLSDSHPLLQHIKCYGSEKGVEVRQWIMYHHELQEKLKASPCILFNELKKELDNVKSLKFDEFLQFLHNYGFIFYRSVEEGEEADEGKVVLLQPEYLCKLFAKVQELSKSKNRFTVADLLSRTASYTRASAKYRQWFQRICIDMGLVVEVAQSDYVFLMGLEAGPSSPDRDLYSVPPLLVTCKDLGREAVEGECLLPSHFFAAFVTEFLRCPTLTQSSRQQKPKQPKFEIMEQHYMQVSIGSTYIHVVEREFCIEIGLQQVEVRGRSTSSEKMLKSLQSFCMRIRKAVTDSADNILRRLKLTQSSLCYGFYHSRKTEDGPLAAFGEYTYMPFEDEPILECSCCDPGVHPTIPLQEIWFEEDFTFKEVCLWYDRGP